MVRHADAFIGIYPLPESPTERVTARQLRSASRYFRLELELATRARKPMAVFYDERFRAHLDLPTGIYQQAYDPQEVLSAGSTPSERRHLLAFASFAISVQKEMQYRAQIESQLLTAPTTIGLLLPPGKQGYPGPLVRQLEDKIEDRGYRTQRLGWPPVLTAGTRQLAAPARLGGHRRGRYGAGRGHPGVPARPRHPDAPPVPRGRRHQGPAPGGTGAVRRLRGRLLRGPALVA